MVYECNSSCLCREDCQNRVLQEVTIVDRLSLIGFWLSLFFPFFSHCRSGRIFFVLWIPLLLAADLVADPSLFRWVLGSVVLISTVVDNPGAGCWDSGLGWATGSSKTWRTFQRRPQVQALQLLGGKLPRVVVAHHGQATAPLIIPCSSCSSVLFSHKFFRYFITIYRILQK